MGKGSAVRFCLFGASAVQLSSTADWQRDACKIAVRNGFKQNRFSKIAVRNRMRLFFGHVVAQLPIFRSVGPSIEKLSLLLRARVVPWFE